MDQLIIVLRWPLSLPVICNKKVSLTTAEGTGSPGTQMATLPLWCGGGFPLGRRKRKLLSLNNQSHPFHKKKSLLRVKCHSDRNYKIKVNLIFNIHSRFCALWFITGLNITYSKNEFILKDKPSKTQSVVSRLFSIPGWQKAGCKRILMRSMEPISWGDSSSLDTLWNSTHGWK